MEVRASAPAGETWFVTSQVSLGDPPGEDGVAVATAQAALDVISSGRRAFLPAGAWDMADEVLWLLDVGPAWRTHQLYWARTGTLQIPVPAEEDWAEPAPRRPTAPASGVGWPDPPDGQKSGPDGALERDLAELASSAGEAYRHEAVLRLAADAAGRGMDRRDALRRALDKTAADDDVYYARMAARLNETVRDYPLNPHPEL